MGNYKTWAVIASLLIIYFFYPSTFNQAISFTEPYLDRAFDTVEDATLTKRTDDKTFEIEKAVFAKTNQQRREPLIWDDKLADVARNHSLDMVQRNFFDHDNPDGQGPTERYIEMWGFVPTKQLGGGYYTEGVAENIGETLTGNTVDCGYVDGSVDDVASCQVSSWMTSPGHRENILEPTYSHIGIGVVRGGIGQYYITQVFW